MAAFLIGTLHNTLFAQFVLGLVNLLHSWSFTKNALQFFVLVEARKTSLSLTACKMSRLLSLPMELRRMVWKYVIPQNADVKYDLRHLLAVQA